MKFDTKSRKIFNKLPSDIKEFILSMEKRCKKDRVIIKFGGGRCLNNGGRCGGYFDSQKRIIAVAMGRNIEDFLSDLIHEYSHWLQSKDRNSVWYNYKIYNGHTRFFNYLGGQRIYKHKDAVMGAIRLEADCERRAIKLAKKWQKYINLNRYQAYANSYILSYHHMLKTGKWLKKSPYHRKIIAHSPTKLLRSHSKVPKKLEEAFVKYL